MVPIAPSNTMTWCGSRRRAISGFSGNCRLRFRRGGGATYRVVLRFRMMNDHRGGRLLRQNLECLGKVHPEGFPGGKKPEDCGVIVEIRTRAISPGVALSARQSQLRLDSPMRPLGHRFR